MVKRFFCGELKTFNHKNTKKNCEIKNTNLIKNHANEKKRRSKSFIKIFLFNLLRENVPKCFFKEIQDYLLET